MTLSIENPLFCKLRNHLGHRTEVAVYGADENVSIECLDCHEVIVDAGKVDSKSGPLIEGFHSFALQERYAPPVAEEVTNLERAAWAELALSAFTQATTPNSGTPRTMIAGDVKASVADLICDLLHYVEANNLGRPSDSLALGWQMFEDECEPTPRDNQTPIGPARVGTAMVADTIAQAERP